MNNIRYLGLKGLTSKGDPWRYRGHTSGECPFIEHGEEVGCWIQTWQGESGRRPCPAKTGMSAGKVMASIYWDAGELLVGYLNEDHTITGTYYADLLR